MERVYNMKRQTKAQHKAGLARFLALMAAHGASPVAGKFPGCYEETHHTHTLTRRGCTLEISYCQSDSGDWIAAKWQDDMEKIRTAGLPYNNQYSGKWNCQGHETAQDALNELEHNLYMIQVKE